MSVVSLLFGVLLCTSICIEAFPFRAKDGVTELDPKSFDSFLDTHKPVMIMFYAPWCGHCKALHPDWTKFGGEMKGLVAVAAVNADQHRELGNRFGIRGFPTIKYWKAGPKKGTQPQDYGGERKAAGLSSFSLSLVNYRDVAVVAKEDDLQLKIAAAPRRVGVVVFSAKGKPPPMLGVLSQSPRLSGAAFLVVPQSLQGLATQLEVSKFPSIVCVNAGEGGLAVHSRFDGPVEYTPLEAFAVKCLGNTESAGDAAPETKSTSEKKDKAAGSVTRPRPAEPLQLQADRWNELCSPQSRIMGRAPICFISVGDDTLAEAAAAVSNEPVVFFYSSQEASGALAKKLTDVIGSNVSVGSVVAIRSTKAGVKAVVSDPGTSAADFIQRVTEGSIAFRGISGFPSLP